MEAGKDHSQTQEKDRGQTEPTDNVSSQNFFIRCVLRGGLDGIL